MKQNPFILLSFFIFNLLTLYGQSEIYINEFQASNYSTIVDNDFIAFSDWVEIYNKSAEPVDISGYFLTDDLQDTQKWQIPANTLVPAEGFLIFWCDKKDIVLSEYHTNFKLSRGGEEIGLFDQNGTLIDSVIFEEQVQDVSYGRKPDGGTDWYYFAQPTPLSQNNTETFLTNEQTPDVEFSIASGFYSSSQYLNLYTTTSNVEIRYTTDGSVPTQNSQLFTTPFTVDSTVVIKARAFKENLLPGNIRSQSYFINESTELSVVSLVINPEFLWDTLIGIYVDENIGDRRYWERSTTIEYFDKDHEPGFTIDADIRLFGNSAIFYPQKSLAVFPDVPLDYQLFDSRETNEFYSFLLRSSSDDWPYTMLRDALMHSVIKDQLNLDYQAYNPSVVFINGDYFGIHNIREKLNERFLATYYNVAPNNVDLMFMDLRDTTIVALEGDTTEFSNMLSFIHSNDLSIDENYNTVKDLIDVENYIDFVASNIFFSNGSWHHNVKVWREKTENAKWRWLLYDLDRGMTYYYLNTYNVLRDIDTTDIFFTHLNQNEDFRNTLLNRLSGFMNSAFEQNRVIHIIDSLANIIENEIPAHSTRWKDECDYQGNCGVQSLNDWYEDIDALRGYNNVAHDKIREYVMDFYNLNGTADLTININNPELGKIYINNIEYKEEGVNWEYFKGIPIQIVAVPNNPNIFLEWQGYSMNDTITVTLEGDKTLNARFASYCFLPPVISEDMILTECEAYLTQGDLTINPDATLTIESGIHIFITNGDSLHVNGQLITNGVLSEPVVFRPANQNQYWGAIYSPDGIIKLDYTEFLDCKSAIYTDGGKVEVKNCTFHFCPYLYGDIFSIHHANTTIQNCLIYGALGEGKTDVIDCDEIQYGLIKDNTIIGTTDDGIDIGTGSSNVTISGNRVFDCLSMGISIGEWSNADVEWNIVSGCEAGIQVHSEAIANIDHNTLYNNEVSIRCFHYSNEPNSGGHAIVENSILSGSQIAVYELYENSTISFAYSLSDTEPIPGEENINADPEFKNADDFDFSLLETSPCIDAGDPLFPLDPDGTRTDIGAVYFDHDSNIIDKHKDQKVYIYPNPATDFIACYLTDTSTTIKDIEIINQHGQKVLVVENVYDNYSGINTKIIKHGTYIVSVITTNNNRYNYKLVIFDNK
ncbi:MAG: CotH kinase family protein [Bacteroidales bacterium]|nr:CotH kinase family protein [Bacteroidales bacterium]